MTVKITKPEINIREKIAELDKPSGIAGEAMLRAETPQEQFNLIGAGRRNLIINGENKISQRGDYTSATAVSESVYYIDRWKTYKNGVTVTLTHKEDQSLPDGSVSHTQRYDVTVAGTGYTGVQQILEETLTVGRYYTISAWVKSNDPNMNLFASGGIQRSFHSGSGDWEKLSITWLESGQGNSYGIINYIFSGNPMVIGNFVEFTQLQLELGKVATPFEHRSYGEELALCQRYFYKWESNAGYNFAAMGYSYSTTDINAILHFPVTMRAPPSLTVAGSWRACSATCVTGTPVGASFNTNSSCVTFACSGISAGVPYMVGDANDATASLSWSAEL